VLIQNALDDFAEMPWHRLAACMPLCPDRRVEIDISHRSLSTVKHLNHIDHIPVLLVPFFLGPEPPRPIFNFIGTTQERRRAWITHHATSSFIQGILNTTPLPHHFLAVPQPARRPVKGELRSPERSEGFP